MSLFTRFKRATAKLHRSVGSHNKTYTLRLPSPLGGAPLCEGVIAVTSTVHAGGETLRVRAHVEGCLSRASAQQTTALPGADSPAATLARRVARRLAQQGLASLPADWSAQRFRTWLDIQTTTAPLAGGADALLPEQLRPLCADWSRAAGGPRLGVWSGPAGGSGRARLALLQIDQDDLPGGDDRQPWHLAASFATVVEPEPDVES